MYNKDLVSSFIWKCWPAGTTALLSGVYLRPWEGFIKVGVTQTTGWMMIKVKNNQIVMYVFLETVEPQMFKTQGEMNICLQNRSNNVQNQQTITGNK